jgi:hypothetical protein
LGVEWLPTLGPITMDFKELYMSFLQVGRCYTSQGNIVGSLEILNSHCMENTLKRDILELSPSSILFKPLRPLSKPFILTCSSSYPNTTQFLKHPKASHPPMVDMMILFHSYLVASHPMFTLSSTYLLRKMKLKRLFKN